MNVNELNSISFYKWLILTLKQSRGHAGLQHTLLIIML